MILARDLDGGVNVVENVCAHRGMSFCRERAGNRRDFTCPYHQWNYSLKGDLQGVPFRRGVRQEGRINGGMPAASTPCPQLGSVQPADCSSQVPSARSAASELAPRTCGS